MESLGAPPGGHIHPTDNNSSTGHAQDGSSPPAQVDTVLDAMIEDLGIGRENDLTLEDNKKRPPPTTRANQNKSNSQAPDPKIQTLIKRYDNQISDWQKYKPADVDETDLLLDNLGNGQSHRIRLEAELAAFRNDGGHSSRGGRGGRAGGFSRGGGHVGQSCSRLDNTRGDRGPKASAKEIEALLRLPKAVGGSVSPDLDRPYGNPFSSRGSTATRGGMPTPTRGTSTHGRTSARGTHMTNDRSTQSKSTSRPTQLFSLATPETFFGSRAATPASQPPVAANIPPAPPSETVVVIEEPSTSDTADSGYSDRNEIFSTNVKFEDFSEIEDRFVECCDGILTIFSTQDGTFHLELIHKSGQHFLLIPFTLIAAYSIESKVDEDSEIEYLVINLHNSTNSGDISTSFRLRTLRKRSWNELMTIIRQNVTAPVDATASAATPTHEKGVPSIRVLQEELISVNDASDSLTPEQGPNGGDSANMRDMWTLKGEERKLAELVVESTMQGMAKQAEQVDEANNSSSSVANEPIITLSTEHTATTHVLKDDSTQLDVHLLRYGRSDMLRLKDRAASIDISTFPEEIRLSDTPKIDESQGLVEKKPQNNGGIDFSIWADPPPTVQSTLRHNATSAAGTSDAKKSFPRYLQYMGGLADSRFTDPPLRTKNATPTAPAIDRANNDGRISSLGRNHDTGGSWRLNNNSVRSEVAVDSPQPSHLPRRPISGLAASRWADDTPTSTQTSSTHMAKTEKPVNHLPLQNEVSYSPNVGSARADGAVNEANRSRSSSRPMVITAAVARFIGSQLTPGRRNPIHTTEEATAGRASLLQTKPIAGLLVEPLTDGVAIDDTSAHEIASAANDLPTEVNGATSAGRSINMLELKATRGIMSSIYASDSENDDVSSSTGAKQSISSAAPHTRVSAVQRTSSASRSINLSQLKATRGIESSRWASDNEDKAGVSIPAKESIVTTPTTHQDQGLADQSTSSGSHRINISQLKATRGIESSRWASDNENDGIDIFSTPTKQSSSSAAQHVSSSSRRLNARSATFKAGSHASRASVDGATFSPTIQSKPSTAMVSAYSPQPILASPAVRHHAIPPPSTLWAKVAVPNLQRLNAIKVIEAVLIGPPREDVSAPGTIIAYVTYADELNPSHMKETEAVLMSPPRDRSHNFFYTHLFPDWHTPPSPGQPSGLMPLYHPQPVSFAAQHYHLRGYPSIAAVHNGFPAHQPVYPVAAPQVATVPAQQSSEASPRERGPNIRIAGATRVQIRSPLSTKPLTLADPSGAAQGKENDKGDA